MKRFLCFILAAAALLAIPTAASAQREYAYGQTVEVMAGWLGNPGRVVPDSPVTGCRNGVDITVRYTYFFGRNVGLFGAVSMGGISQCSPERYFARVNAADGRKFRYDDRYGLDSYHLPALIVGPAFRYDRDRLSVRPRIGVGVTAYDPDMPCYFRYSRDVPDAAPEFVRTNVNVNYYTDDYLCNGNATRYPSTSASFVAFAGLQLTYMVTNHFFLSLEASYKGVVSSIRYGTETYSTKPAYDPHSWVEAVYQYNRKGEWDVDYSAGPQVAPASRLVNMVGVSVGFGWNIGWNRYESGWYDRSRK